MAPETAATRLDVWLDVACLFRTRSEAGRRQRVVIRTTAEQHVARALARAMYEDTTPPPSPEEQALRDLLRLAGPRRPSSQTSPDRRERRRIRRAKEAGD